MSSARYYAGFWRRLLAAILDSIVVGIIISVTHLLFFTNTSNMLLDVNSSGFNFAETSSNDWVEQFLVFLFTIVMWVKYLGTPGKLVLGCHVVDAKTFQPLSTGQAIARYLSYIPSLLLIGLGFLWIGLDKRKQGLHDKIAGTVVLLEADSSVKEDLSQRTLQELLDDVK